jgi:hypothetical protein
LSRSLGFVAEDFNKEGNEDDEETQAKKLLLKEEEQKKQEEYQLIQTIEKDP